MLCKLFLQFNSIGSNTVQNILRILLSEINVTVVTILIEIRFFRKARPTNEARLLILNSIFVLFLIPCGLNYYAELCIPVSPRLLSGSLVFYTDLLHWDTIRCKHNSKSELYRILKITSYEDFRNCAVCLSGCSFKTLLVWYIYPYNIIVFANKTFNKRIFK